MTDCLNSGYLNSEELRRLGFAAVGENVKIARNATVVSPDRIELGDQVRIDSYASLIAGSGFIRFGSYIHIAGGCHLLGTGGITMDDFSALSNGVRIFSSSDDYSGEAMTNPTVPAHLLNAEIAPVAIGRHVIVGSGALIMPGVSIGEGVAVGAMSLVKRSLPAWNIYAGCPVVWRKKRSKNLLALEKQLIQPQQQNQDD